MVEIHVATQAMSSIDVLRLIGLGYVLAIAAIVWFFMGARNG